MHITVSKWLTIFGFCTLVLTGCVSEPNIYPGSYPKPKVLAEFDFPADVRAIILPVSFEGQEYDFILDTGTNTTIFDTTLKDQLGKRFLWPKKAKIAGGKYAIVEYYSAPEAYIGPLNLVADSRLVGVMDLQVISTSLERKIYGIIGMNFLRKYIVQINSDEAKVVFFEPYKKTGIFSLGKSGLNSYPEWGEQIPINFSNKLPYVRGKFNDKLTVNFLIDSGNLIPMGFGGLENKVFQKICTSVENHHIKERTSELSPSGFSNIPNEAAFIENFSIGLLAYKDAYFRQTTRSSLGLFFLHLHLVTFDFPNNKMYLKKRSIFDDVTKKEIDIAEFGLNLSHNNNDFIVLSLEADGLALRAGLKEIDVIIKVNEYDIISYSVTRFLNLINSLFLSNASDITFTVRRAQEVKQIVIPRDNRHDDF